jgi:glycosyltransferase involved in cell wall biosynthesis
MHRQPAGSDVWYVSITDFPRGQGATTRARSICQALAQAGYRVSLLIPYALGQSQNEAVAGVAHGVSYEYLNRSARRPGSAARVALAKVHANLVMLGRVRRRRRSLAAVFVYNASAFDCWGTLLAGRLCGVPVILDWADEWHDPETPVRSLGLARYLFQRLSRATESLVFRGATAIIVVSRYLQRRLAHYAAKTQLCAVAFDPSIFASAVPERLESSSARFEVVYAGSISGTEGTHVLLEAVRQLRAECRERVRLFIIGNPAQNETIGEYLAAAEDLVQAGLVTFMPAVSHERYASIARGADLLVVPRTTTVASRAGFPYKIVEYMATGRPVLTTRFGDVCEYFTAGTHCLMCQPDDPRALAEALELAIAQPEALAAVALAGQRRVEELFAFDAVAVHLDRLIRTGETPR